MYGVVVGSGAGKFNAEPVVAGNHIAGPGSGAADMVTGRPQAHHDAGHRTGGCSAVDVDTTRRVGTDIIALDDVVVAVVEEHAMRGVPRDHVARRGIYTTNSVVRCVKKMDAITTIANGCVAGGIQADIVAGDRVAGRGGCEDVDAIGGIAGDHVAIGRTGSADRVVGPQHPNTGARINFCGTRAGAARI